MTMQRSPNQTRAIQSWGHYPKVKHAKIIPISSQNDLPDLTRMDRPMLPHAYGRSYGDSGLNENGILLDVSPLRHILSFDKEHGLFRCEAGVSLATILEIIVPHGWFLPVSPGTKFISVGGAIANDVHGKNHHTQGTFGCHVTCFELLCSDGQRLLCSPEENASLFEATIGGLGLTGVILWAEFKLRRIVNPYIDSGSILFRSLDEFFEIEAESEEGFEYRASWVDVLIGGKALCRGTYGRGNHSNDPELASTPLKKPFSLPLPFTFPQFALNRLTVRSFNELCYHRQLSRRVSKVISYEPFIYPLDMLGPFYRLYGKRGFLQHHFIVPFEGGREALSEILKRIRASGSGSFLTVFKTFGQVKSPGMLSFPRPGITLALDFPYTGKTTLSLLEELDTIVRHFHGTVYPAKDARMSAESFQQFYPRWKEFSQYVDPRFSSNLWRRVSREWS